TFFRSNPGMASRVAHHLDFPDYSDAELQEIARLIAAQMGYRFSPEGERAMDEYVRLRRRRPNFANARSIRNALDRARLRQANRLIKTARPVTAAELSLIEAADLRSSRVFSEKEA
ncbi:MAG: CbbX protein, partial [Pseudomonadota bacterium]